jgi:hypothetical protein
MKVTSNFYGEIKYTEAVDFINNFQALPSALYIRGHLNDSPEAIEKYRADLIFKDSASSGNAVWISQPIDWFEFTDEELQLSGLAEYGVVAGTKYILNGNNRQSVVSGLFNDEILGEKLAFYPVPTRQIDASVLNYPTILELQRTANDTTVQHSSQNLITTIAAYWKSLTDAGKSESVASAQCALMFRVTASYVSNAKALVGCPAPFLKMFDSGAVALSTVIVINQSYEAIKKQLEAAKKEFTPQDMVSGLTAAYASDLRLGDMSSSKAPISAAKVKSWVNTFINLNVPTVEQPASDLSPLPEGCTKNEDGTITNANGEVVGVAPKPDSDAPKAYSPEFLETARSNVKKFIPALVHIDDMLNEEIKPETADLFKSANKKLTQIIGDIVNEMCKETPFATYSELVSLLEEFFNRLAPHNVTDESLLDRLNAKVSSVLSKEITSIVAMVSPPPAAPNLDHVDDEDEDEELDDDEDEEIDSEDAELSDDDDEDEDDYEI